MNTKIEQYVLSVLVDNSIGVLNRVAGLFSRRGYNIKSLNVAETEASTFSRMTIVVEGDERTVTQICKQLNKLYDVSFVRVLENAVCREHILIRVGSAEEKRHALVELANLFRAKAVDIKADSMMFELTGEPQKIDSFIELMKPYGILKMARTGVSALERD